MDDQLRAAVPFAPGAEVVAQARRVLAEARSLTRLAAGLHAGMRGSQAIAEARSAFYQALPELLGPARTQLPGLDHRSARTRHRDRSARCSPASWTSASFVHRWTAGWMRET